MLSMSLKVKDVFIVSGKSGYPQPEQCAELVGLHWRSTLQFKLKTLTNFPLQD